VEGSSSDIIKNVGSTGSSIAATICAFGQAANEQGIKPSGSYHGGDIDSVNVSNRHLELRIPLLGYPQRGNALKLNFVARFHNAVWNERTDCAATTNICIHIWEFDDQPNVQIANETGVPSIDQQLVSGGNSSSPVYSYSVRMADESQHPLGNLAGTIFETVNATGIKWDSSTQTVTMPNGTRYSGIFGGTPVMEDTNGNQIVFNGGTTTDTMGRTIPSATSTSDNTGCTGLLPISSIALWVVPGANGGSNTFKFCYAQVKIYTHHWTQQNTSTNTYLEPNGLYSMLQSIVLPDQTAWTFEYSQPDSSGVNWGDLVKVTYPSGGSIAYTWGHFQGCRLPTGAPGLWSGKISKRTVDAHDGKPSHDWVYTPGSAAGQTIVRDPLLNDTVHTFTDLNTSCSFYEIKTEYYSGEQTGGVLLQTVTTDYSWASPGASHPPINVVPSRKTTSWPNGKVKKTEYSYDSGFTYSGSTIGIYGKQTAVNEFDYGSGAPGALLKSTSTAYIWQSPAGSQYKDNNILDVPTVITVQDGSGNTASQTTIAYDGTVPSASGITTSHEANPVNGNVRGNATSISRWLNGSTVSTPNCQVTQGPLTSSKTFLDTGMVSQTKDACLQPTNFQFSSVYAGAYLTSSCDALNHCTTMDYDFNTGSITGSTDPNGQVSGKKTSYTYDSIGRLTNIAYPDGGQTNAYYPDPITVEVKKLQDSAANVWIDQYAYFDGLLRSLQTRLVDPEGDVYSETGYDELGRIFTVTNPHRNSAAPTDGTTTTHYDVLGRIINIIRPDGNAIQKNYTDPGVTTLIDETGRLRRETRDALGRLTKVEEPSGGIVGSKATASVTINGTLQSKIVGGQAATQASATILISGQPAYCDGGMVTLNVGNAPADSVSYGCLSTAQQIAQALAGSLSSSQVTATASQVSDSSHWQIVLNAITAGTGGNGISFSIGYSSFYPGQFGAPYTLNPASGALSGGQNAVAGTTVYDAGTVTLGLNGYSATANYGTGTGLDGTAAAVASDLVSRINAQLPGTNPPFAISVPAGGTAISVTWGSVGSAGNLNLMTTSSATTQTSNFSVPSFAGCQVTSNPQNCNAAFSGGTDPYSLDSPPAWPTLYSYDILGNLLRVEQHGNTTDSTQWRIRTFQYDSLSRLTQSNNPEAGQLNFTYDADGSVVTRTDARGITITYGYDPLHRLTTKQYSDGSSPNEYYYDTTPPFNYNAPNHGSSIGRLTHASNDVNAGFDPVYDPMGRITAQVYCLPSNCTYSMSSSATYDLLGHLTSLTYPSGRTVSSGYNSAGRALNSVFTNFGGVAANYPYYTAPQGATSSAWGYNPDGSLHLGTFGNGIIETYGFNNRQQLNAITASSSGQTWLSKLYGLYDVNSHNNGMISSIIDVISPTRNQFYQYDPVGRVTSGYQQDNAFNQTFNYDPWGNMTTSGTNNFNPLYGGNNRISGAPANCTASNTYCYDLAGNLLNDAFHQYAYDGENRVKSVDNTGATYTYGAVGERVRKDTGGKGTEYVYFQGRAIAEKDVSTGYWSDYIFFNGRRIARSNNFEHQIHFTGQVCSNCGWQWYQFNFTNLGSLAGHTIQAGDSLRWLQWQNSGTAGGVIITFTDGTDSCCTGGLNLIDQNGEFISKSTMVNMWDYRVANLNAAVGKTISQIRLYIDGTTLPGQWGIYFQDVAFNGADGAVQPLFSQNATLPSLSGFGTSGMTQISSSIHDCSGSGCAAINNTTYFHDDQIGSARLLSNGYGYPIWQGTFTPFGQEVSPQLTSNHYKFNGKERGEAAEGTLDYFGARYYSSVIGRWMTPDWSDEPVAVPYANYTNPQSLNLYSFVTDDPLSHTDLDGHEQFTLGNDPNGLEASKTNKCGWWCRYKKWREEKEIEDERQVLINHCKSDACKAYYKKATSQQVQWRYLYETNTEFRHYQDLVWALAAGVRPKPPNLPAQNKIEVDVEHSIDNHTTGGSGYQQSAKMGGQKDLWPEGYDKGMIEKALRGAYDNASKVGRQFNEGGDIFKLRGTYGGMNIEMWLDTSTNVLRGYPVW
jgi:RHS repeat-associated protein